MPGGGSSSRNAEPDGAAAALSPTILSIDVRGAAGETARVRLSDGSSFIAAAELIAASGLCAGAALDEEALRDIRARSDRLLARSRALSLLARGAYTRRGLARKLAARGFGAEAVEAALERMAELGYLDDRAFAFDWARARVGARAEGWKAVYRGLLRKGVPRKIAAEAAAEVCSDENELRMARRLAGNLTRRAAANRLAARGFRTRTIARVLRDLAARRPETA